MGAYQECLSVCSDQCPHQNKPNRFFHYHPWLGFSLLPNAVLEFHRLLENTLALTPGSTLAHLEWWQILLLLGAIQDWQLKGLVDQLVLFVNRVSDELRVEKFFFVFFFVFCLNPNLLFIKHPSFFLCLTYTIFFSKLYSTIEQIPIFFSSS